ncbi:MAG: biotin transporter BioY [Thermoleophilia bacterium]|nr:biotin transporter BioY [Thermoleophilia bacterium]
MRRNSRDIAAVQSADPRALLGAAARSTVLAATLVTAGVAALTAGAWLSVPFYPVPLTMQTLAVLVVGGLLGPRLGVAAVTSYLALGLAGAPVFHAGLGGPAVLLGPTGGYLLGFLPAALLMGLLAQRARRSGLGGRASFRATVRLVTGAALAEAAIYTLGVSWLAVAYAGGDLRQAVAVGLVPYLLGDLLKMAVAVGAVKLGARALGRWGSLPV